VLLFHSLPTLSCVKLAWEYKATFFYEMGLQREEEGRTKKLPPKLFFIITPTE